MNSTRLYCLEIPAIGAPIMTADTAEAESAHFHHVHLNVTDPQATLDFYKKFLGATQVKYRGVSDALFTEKSFILMTKVDSAPPSGKKSALDHIGWGGIWMNALQLDNVSIVIFGKPEDPAAPWWPEGLREGVEPTTGRVMDHIAFSFRDIEPHFERMKAADVEIVEPIAESKEFGHRSFFVLVPDEILVEIVEDKPIPEGIWDQEDRRGWRVRKRRPRCPIMMLTVAKSHLAKNLGGTSTKALV